MSGAFAMAIAALITLGTLAWLIAALVRSIHDERTQGRGVLREFGLGLVLMLLFFATWLAHGITSWQTYTDEQHAHGETTELGDFVSEFGQGTLENWQSEFLQLFSFVTLAALYIHKGSAESKDSDEKVEASLRRIEEHLGTLPSGAPHRDEPDGWKLPHTPLEAEDRALVEVDATSDRSRSPASTSG
jgi:hypothetical protein